MFTALSLLHNNNSNTNTLQQTRYRQRATHSHPQEWLGVCGLARKARTVSFGIVLAQRGAVRRGARAPDRRATSEGRAAALRARQSQGGGPWHTRRSCMRSGMHVQSPSHAVDQLGSASSVKNAERRGPQPSDRCPTRAPDSAQHTTQPRSACVED